MKVVEDTYDRFIFSPELFIAGYKPVLVSLKNAVNAIRYGLALHLADHTGYKCVSCVHVWVRVRLK